MALENLDNQQLSKLLSNQKVRLQQMLNLLGEELLAVKDRNGTAILEVSNKKELQLEAIRNADKQLSTNNAKELISTTPALAEIRDEIVELLEQCQTQNEVIYLAASQNQIAVEQVKSLLIGGSKNTTYDQHGQKRSSGNLGSGIKA
jgi:flagellar biosynthesis/type III secretory pathway chaperone